MLSMCHDDLLILSLRMQCESDELVRQVVSPGDCGRRIAFFSLLGEKFKNPADGTNTFSRRCLALLENAISFFTFFSRAFSDLTARHMADDGNEKYPECQECQHHFTTTLPEIKAHVRQKLRESGAIDVILAQLPVHLIRPLLENIPKDSKYNHGRAFFPPDVPWEHVVLNSLVVDFLRHGNFCNTLATFMRESHMLVQRKPLSRSHVAEALGLKNAKSQENQSLLHVLVGPGPVFRSATFVSVMSSQTQTDVQKDPQFWPPPYQCYEQKFRQFQEECGARVAREKAEELAHFRETDLMHMRLEEAAKHRRELSMLQEQMKAREEARIEEARAQTREETRLVQARLQAGEAVQYAARQAVLREKEGLKVREAAVERAEARVTQRYKALDKAEQELQDKVEAWKQERTQEVSAARQAGASLYSTQLQSLRRQQQLLQEELRKLEAERVDCHEQALASQDLRRELEEARACVTEVGRLRKENARLVAEKHRLQAQEENAWAREQQATEKERCLERSCRDLRVEVEKLGRAREEDEEELLALREEVTGLRALMRASQQALHSLGAQAATREALIDQVLPTRPPSTGAPRTTPLFHSSCAGFSSIGTRDARSMREKQDLRPVSRTTVSPSRLRDRLLSGKQTYTLPSSPSSSSPALSSPSSSPSDWPPALTAAMQAYEGEVQKLQEIHDEFAQRRENCRFALSSPTNTNDTSAKCDRTLGEYQLGAPSIRDDAVEAVGVAGRREDVTGEDGERLERTEVLAGVSKVENVDGIKKEGGGGTTHWQEEERDTEKESAEEGKRKEERREDDEEEGVGEEGEGEEGVDREGEDGKEKKEGDEEREAMEEGEDSFEEETEEESSEEGK